MGQVMLCPQRPQNFILGGYAPPQRRQIRSAWGGKLRPGIDDEGCDGLGAIFSPQRPQNLEFSGRGTEHLGHGNDRPVSPGLTTANERPPHRPQNFTPSANRELQVVQATIPGIRLECTPLLLLPPLAAPCDGVG